MVSENEVLNMQLNEFKAGVNEVLTNMGKEYAENTAKMEKLNNTPGDHLSNKGWDELRNAKSACYHESKAIIERARGNIRGLADEFCKKAYPAERLNPALLRPENVTYLNSGIKLTSQELGELHDDIVKGVGAENIPAYQLADWRATNMRLLKDYATENGVAVAGVEAYLTNVEKADSFKHGIDEVLRVKSMDDGNAEAVKGYFDMVLSD